MGWQVEKVVFYNFLYCLGGHKFFMTPTVQMRDFKARIYLDIFFLLSCDFLSLFSFQEPVEILGPVEIRASRIESVNGVLLTYTRI